MLYVRFVSLFYSRYIWGRFTVLNTRLQSIVTTGGLIAFIIIVFTANGHKNITL